MKLAAKLVAVILLEIAVLLAIDGYLAVQRERWLFQSDMQRDAHVLGNVLKDFVADTWKHEGQERASQLLDKANREQHQLRIRWVRLGGSADRRHRALAPHNVIASVARGQEMTVPVTDQDGYDHFCTYVPIAVPTLPAAAIELAEPLSQLDAFTGGITKRNLVLGFVLATAAGVSVVSLGVVLVGRPLDELTEKARQIGKGDLTPSLKARGHDELAELARSMNDTCRKLAESKEQTRLEQERRIAAIEQLQRADRLRTVGQLAAGVAHELGTPLNTISIRSGMMASGELVRDEIQENARIIKSQSQRMTAIIRELLDYAHPRAPQRTLIDLRQLARDTIQLLAPLGRKHNATTTLSETESTCVAMVDGDQIQQVLTNLLVNAMQAEPGGGRQVDVDVTHAEAALPDGSDLTRNQYIRIAIRDNGAGISKEILKNIFDPFFTTKDVGEGTGLGLSVAYGIVQEHGGWIDVASQLGAGSCFAVYLPVAATNDECPIQTNAGGNGNLK